MESRNEREQEIWREKGRGKRGGISVRVEIVEECIYCTCTMQTRAHIHIHVHMYLSEASVIETAASLASSSALRLPSFSN